MPYDPIGKIPDLPIPDFAQVAAYADQDPKIHADLSMILQQAKKHQPVYVSKLQQLTDNTAILQFQWNHTFPLSLFSLAWDIILTIILLFLFMLLRKYGAACPTSLPPTVPMAVTYCAWYVSALLSLYVIVC